MTHTDTKHMIELVEQRTGYRVNVDLISGIHEHARMISARPENPVHMIGVNETHRAFADYIVAVQCGILLVLWSDPQKVPAMALEERATTALAARWAGLTPLASLPADVSSKVARHYVEGLVKQVQSMPLEIGVAKLVFDKCPALREAQAESFRAQLQNLSQVFTAKVKDSAPLEVFQKNVAMNAALALGWSEISGDRIALLPYKSTGHLESGRQLFAALQAVSKPRFVGLHWSRRHLGAHPLARGALPMGFFEPSNMTPFSFQFPLADFALTRLPVDPALLRGDASMLASAVQEFYRDSFEKLGGSATVLVSGGVVSVAWQPESVDASAQLLQHAIDLLRQGNASSAEPILRALLAQDARNADALYNLGMMLSDQGRLAEAVETLQESLNFHPTHSEGWTALGVAQARLNAMPEAVKALERAIEIDSGNAHALRNLAAIHAKESPSRALPFMQEAAQLLPQDQRSQYGLAQCLLQLDRVDEADPLLVKAISLDPLSEIAEFARTDRTRIAQANLRSNAGGGTRPDAVFFCLDAMQKFHALGEAQTKAITFEVAMLGRGGFDINSPDKKYTLKSLPGQFSGLHLVSIMYVGMKSLAPTVDVGIDLSEEYAEAKRLFALE